MRNWEFTPGTPTADYFVLSSHVGGLIRPSPASPTFHDRTLPLRYPTATTAATRNQRLLRPGASKVFCFTAASNWLVRLRLLPVLQLTSGKSYLRFPFQGRWFEMPRGEPKPNGLPPKGEWHARAGLMARIPYLYPVAVSPADDRPTLPGQPRDPKAPFRVVRALQQETACTCSG